MSIRRYWPALVGVGLVIFMAVLPLLNISIPGILPTPTYQPGTLALLSLCMVFASLALSYNLLLGTSGMLSFGHALYFAVSAYAAAFKAARAAGVEVIALGCAISPEGVELAGPVTFEDPA